MRACLEQPSGDPGRVHAEGRAARAVLEDARDQVAGALGVRPRQVVFTSGATEAVHTAVFSATWQRPGAAVLAAPVEHSAVRDASARLAPLVPLPVDRNGRIALDGVDEALAVARGAALVHCQWANHEVGTCQPVEEVVARAHRGGVPVHVDAAAAFGHVPLGASLGLDDPDGADLVSLSAHKMGGPPGVGALVVGRGTRIEPLFVGGHQERGRRAGMENAPGIAGFGAAASALAGGVLEREAERARTLTERVSATVAGVAGTVQVGDPLDRLPHLVCFGVGGVEAEAVLLGLDRRGIAAHSGSACSSESLEPSPVLAAMGADPSHSLRVSVGWSTTTEDIEAFNGAFGAVVAELRALAS